MSDRGQSAITRILVMEYVGAHLTGLAGIVTRYGGDLAEGDAAALIDYKRAGERLTHALVSSLSEQAERETE